MNDSKSAMGAASHEADVSPNSMRLYERLGLLTPARDSTGRRLYSAKDIAKAKAIKKTRLAARGSGLRGAKAIART